MLSATGILLITLPIPFAIYGVWRDYLVRKKKFELIWVSLLASLPIFSLICMLLVFFYKGDEDDDYFLGYKKHLNKIRACYNCGITSRLYQYKRDDFKVQCPRCGESRMSCAKSDDNEKFPFAPRLNDYGAIKYILNENKLNKISNKLKNTERYDKELEAYEQLQMKKLQELEAKANEIRAELTKGELN